MSSSLTEKILSYKKQRNAVILAHNYQRAEVQDIADFVGDSLGLSQAAARATADVIVFCGVHFMAETAAILCPDKTVLLPDQNAGCPMADMITDQQLRDLKKQHPGIPVVCYVNTTAAVKAESDICCTSSNAVKIVNAAPSDTLIFVPDKNLGMYAARNSAKKLIYVNGYCPIHASILAQHIIDAKARYPQAKVIVHPECTPDVISLADAALSTTGMCDYAKSAPEREFIIGTEVEMLYRLRTQNPGKLFYPASEHASCKNMKKTTLEKILWSLEEMKPRITVDPQIRSRALTAIQKMLSLS